MIKLTLHLYRDEDDYAEVPTRMPVVPRVGEELDAEGKMYEVEKVVHVLEGGEWGIYVWTKPAT